MSTIIRREAQGVTVQRSTSGWPRSTEITVDGETIRLFGAHQARALIWALSEVERADGETE